MIPTTICYNLKNLIHTIPRKDERMNIDIRKSIRANFNQSDEKEILDAIEGAIADQERENIVKIIQKNLA